LTKCISLTNCTDTFRLNVTVDTLVVNRLAFCSTYRTVTPRTCRLPALNTRLKTLHRVPRRYGNKLYSYMKLICSNTVIQIDLGYFLFLQHEMLNNDSGTDEIKHLFFLCTACGYWEQPSNSASFLSLSPLLYLFRPCEGISPSSPRALRCTPHQIVLPLIVFAFSKCW